MAGILFGDFSGISKRARRKGFWSSVLVDVIAWGVSLGIAAAVIGFVSTVFFCLSGLADTSGMMGEADSGVLGIITVIVTSLLGALVQGFFALLAGLVFGFISGMIDARLGGLVGISGGRGIALGVISGITGILYGIMVVMVFGFIFLISGGTGSDILEFVGISAEGDYSWVIIIALVVIVVAAGIIYALLGFLLGAISGAIAGIGNIFLKGKLRVFSEITPAVLVFAFIGLSMGFYISSSNGSIIAIVISIVCGVVLGIVYGLLLGTFRYVIPDRFINRAKIKTDNEVNG